MRIAVCYTELDPRTEELARKHLPGAEFVPTPVGDHNAYWRETRARWDGTQDLVTIEQDIGVHASVYPEFASCGYLWCSFGYRLGYDVDSILYLGNGCRRISAELQRMVTADMIEAANVLPCEHCDPLCWRHLDAVVASTFHNHGLRVHQHWPPVTHYHYENFAGEPEPRVLYPSGVEYWHVHSSDGVQAHHAVP